MSPVINSADLPDVNNDSPIDIKIENQKPSQPGVQILDGKPVVATTSTLSCTLNRSSVVASDDSAIPKYQYQWLRQRQGNGKISVTLSLFQANSSERHSRGRRLEMQRYGSAGRGARCAWLCRGENSGSGRQYSPSSSLIASVSIDRSHGCGTSDNPRFASTIGTIRCDTQLNSGFSGELSYGWFVDDIFRELEQAFSVASFDLQGVKGFDAAPVSGTSKKAIWVRIRRIAEIRDI